MSTAADAIGGEFLARALGTIVAARIESPLVTSNSAGEERLWVSLFESFFVSFFCLHSTSSSFVFR